MFITSTYRNSEQGGHLQDIGHQFAGLAFRSDVVSFIPDGKVHVKAPESDSPVRTATIQLGRRALMDFGRPLGIHNDLRQLFPYGTEVELLMRIDDALGVGEQSAPVISIGTERDVARVSATTMTSSDEEVTVKVDSTLSDDFEHGRQALQTIEDPNVLVPLAGFILEKAERVAVNQI